MVESITLVQPRHCYAGPEGLDGLGHVYFPTSLYVLAARLRRAGLKVDIHDENLSAEAGGEGAFGFAVIGSPYIQPVASRVDRARKNGARIIAVGGQGVRGLLDSEFMRLYGEGTVNGSSDRELVQAGIVAMPLAAQEDISITEELSLLSNDLFGLYFSLETPLYLSQGCRYSCTFCGATRSRTAQVAGPKSLVREVYRNIECIDKELRVIAARSRKLGISENRFYLSNLDLFQSPPQLAEFVACVETVLADFPTHRFWFRGLSTSASFMSVVRHDRDLVSRFVNVGLRRVGFGIDGATPEVWKAIRKPHASDACLEALAVAREEFEIEPEALMVFGHEGHDSERSLGLAVDTVRYLVEHFGAIPRPHVAKGSIPGNDGWYSHDYSQEKEFLLENPWAFQFLDFTCLPTDITHRDLEFREAVARSFMDICDMPTCLTQYVLPEDQRLPPDMLNRAVAFNRGRFDI